MLDTNLRHLWLISSTCLTRGFLRTPNHILIMCTRGLPYLWMISSPGSLHSSKEAVGSSVAPLASPSHTTESHSTGSTHGVSACPARRHSGKSVKGKKKKKSKPVCQRVCWLVETKSGRISFFFSTGADVVFTAGNHLPCSSTLTLIPFCQTNRCVPVQ